MKVKNNKSNNPVAAGHLIARRHEVQAKQSPQSIKLDAKEKYTRLFSIKNGNAISLRSGCVVLKKNESIGEHNTDKSEEIIIILEGRGELSIRSPLPVGKRVGMREGQQHGYKKWRFGRNTALYIPPDTIHDIKNTGRNLLRYIFVTCPAK